MKVLHVAPSYARLDGGPSEVLRGLLPALQSHHEVRLVTTDKRTRPGEPVPIAQTEVSLALPPQRWSFAPGLIRVLEHQVRWADVVHVHGVDNFPTSAALAMSTRHSKPVFLQPHGALNPYHRVHNQSLKTIYFQAIDRRWLRCVRALVVSSSKEAEAASALLPGVTVWAVPLGVDESLFHVQKVPRSDKPPTVLFLGRLARKKRVDLAIEAMTDARLRQRNMRLVVAGDVDNDLPYDPATLARRLGISPHVSFAGAVDRATRARLLATADVFLLPSEDESFGVAAAEAMAAGCPVVLTPEVGVSERAVPYGAAIACNRETADIAAAIEQALDGSAALSARGRRLASEEFTWVRAAGLLNDAYLSVWEGNRCV